MAFTGYVGLGSLSNNTFTESTQTGYARKAFAFNDPKSDGTVAGIGPWVTFTTTTATPAAVGAYAFYSASSGGTPLLVYPIQQAVFYGANSPVTVNPHLIRFNIADGRTHENLPAVGASKAGAITGVAAPATQNLTASTDPGASNDITQGYDVGSQWINTTSRVVWTCVDGTATAAKWINQGAVYANTYNVQSTITGTLSGGTKPRITAAGQVGVLGLLVGANFNAAATDQAIPIDFLTAGSANQLSASAANKYIITEIRVVNPSVSLTTAQGGFYTAVSGGGTIIGATTTAYTGATSATTCQRLTGLTNMDNTVFTAATLYLRLTTAQGAAATADVYIIGMPFI
jgi:hypothetical protein